MMLFPHSGASTGLFAYLQYWELKKKKIPRHMLFKTDDSESVQISYFNS